MILDLEGKGKREKEEGEGLWVHKNTGGPGGPVTLVCYLVDVW